MDSFIIPMATRDHRLAENRRVNRYNCCAKIAPGVDERHCRSR
jgi:hypothetical protein